MKRVTIASVIIFLMTSTTAVSATSFAVDKACYDMHVQRGVAPSQAEVMCLRDPAK